MRFSPGVVGWWGSSCAKEVNGFHGSHLFAPTANRFCTGMTDQFLRKAHMDESSIQDGLAKLEKSTAVSGVANRRPIAVALSRGGTAYRL